MVSSTVSVSLSLSLFISHLGGVDFTSSRLVGQFDAMTADIDKCFNVHVLSDSLVEGEESFTVTLHLLTNLSPSLADRIIIDENQMKVTIIDTSMQHNCVCMCLSATMCTCVSVHDQMACPCVFMCLLPRAHAQGVKWSVLSVCRLSVR